MAHFCKQYDKSLMKFTPEAEDRLTAHPWYGNIRELEHVIEKAAIINDSPLIPAEFFQLSVPRIAIQEQNISTQMCIRDRSVEVQPACEDIRARQSHERKASTVRTSTDRLHQRCDTGFLHGVERQVHDELLRFDHLTHIVILVAQFERRTARMHLVHSLHQLVQQLFLPFESSAHMVAYDLGKRSLLDRSAYAGQMEKAFITGRMFGTLRDKMCIRDSA